MRQLRNILLNYLYGYINISVNSPIRYKFNLSLVAHVTQCATSNIIFSCESTLHGLKHHLRIYTHSRASWRQEILPGHAVSRPLPTRSYNTYISIHIPTWIHQVSIQNCARSCTMNSAWTQLEISATSLVTKDVYVLCTPPLITISTWIDIPQYIDRYCPKFGCGLSELHSCIGFSANCNDEIST